MANAAVQVRAGHKPAGAKRGRSAYICPVSLGFLRCFLALLVLNGHLFGPWWPASYAVFSFYAISGYLMTWIMKGKYGFARSGITAFCLNRLLRIHPPYYAAALLSLGLIVWLGDDVTSAFNPRLRMPADWSQVLPNITLLGLTWGAESRLVPPAWALHVELCCYVLIAVAFARSLRWALGWLAISLGYLLYLRVSGETGFEARYGTVLAAGLPFSLGCCLFQVQPWLRERMSKTASSAELVVSLGLYLLGFVLGALSSNPKGWVFYYNVLATLPLVNALSRTSWQSERLRRWDSLVGDLSYPIYLIHWQAGLVALHVFGMPARSLQLMAVASLVAVGFGLFERRFVSGTVERIRKYVTRRAANMRRASMPPLSRPSWLPSLRVSRPPGMRASLPPGGENTAQSPGPGPTSGGQP